MNPPTTRAGLLRLDGVHVRRDRAEVVHDVTLGIERGEVVALLGPNGAGKSTLLEAVGGVLGTSAGTVSVDGRVASVLQAPGLARRTVRANVELALAWWGVPRRQRRARAETALEQIRASHLVRRPAWSLSGGERRRVHVARGLALRPDLLLLDEPFAGLDPETRAALCEDTASALREVAGGVLVVLHDRAEAWALADRLVVMVDGRVVASGTPAAVLARPPSAGVARFLGYDGELRAAGSVTLTRSTQVRIVHGDPSPTDRPATVRRVVTLQDGARVELELDDGRLRAWSPDPAPSPGDRVSVRVEGGVSFPVDSGGPLP